MLAAYRNLLKTAHGRSRLAWVGYIFVTLLAGILRFYNLANPAKLVFDETYYVKDAYTLSQSGVELSWPNNPNPAFEAGKVHTFLNDPAFVVHPPLGKWLIAVGMNIFGADNSFGWRFSSALFGTLTVALTILVAWQLMRSVTWSIAAGFLMAIDGHAIVLSRTALLDGFLGFFALLAFYFVMRDREQNRLRILQHPSINVIWNRPWLMAAAVALGAATGVKWSGVWFAVIFGAYVCVSEALFRLRVEAIEGETPNHHEKPVALAIWQSLANLVLMVPLFLATYLSTWAGWLASDRGWDAKWASSPINQFWGIFNLVPQKLQSLWHYHQEALNFHVNLHTPHSYASNPLTWLLLYRPTSFFYEGAANGEAGCTLSEGCSSAITALGNPAIWYAALIALVLLVIRYFKHRESVPGLILLGIAAGYLPWLVFMNRTVFQFYAITFLPWLVLALTFILKSWLQGSASELRQKAEQRLLIFFALATAVSIYFYPIWIGLQVSYWFWSAHMWIPSWI